ncbi:hypothetical protein RE6C_05401 [Rhodopirellula europaea 6C]|uniref:Type II secretion system protein GspE N-terminal domain-containing protein n=2 Tax=Rhodopirellula TaxID=265488 RepID=M2AWC9_9BACT|nr:hypothetical protein RE6C_05401 [Rhodopirellula europaea 6C]
MLTLEQLQRLTLDGDAIERVPESVAREHCVLPIGFADDRLSLVLPTDLDERTYDLIKFVLEFDFDYETADRQTLRNFVHLFYWAVYSDVRNCSDEFRFKCPKMWIDLAATSDPMIRHCGTCDRKVHYCDSTMEFDKHRKRGDCVAFVDRDTSATTLGLPM